MPCEALAASSPVVPAEELNYRRVVRALRARMRYRYVRPELRRVGYGFVVRSPCCSRNVDADGGVIDIAWIERTDHGWRLHHRDHTARRWTLVVDGPLPHLLELLCTDPERLFWP
jgi:hypothetical protein